MIWFGGVLWHINHYRLFNAKFSLYIYIRYIGFGLVGFYGISTIVGYLMPNPFYTYILNIYDLVCLGLWHINHCTLSKAKSSLLSSSSSCRAISTDIPDPLSPPLPIVPCFRQLITTTSCISTELYVVSRWSFCLCSSLWRGTQEYITFYPLYTYIKYIWFVFVLWHINHCRLFNAKYSLNVYIKYIWFGLFWFYGISTIVGYLMPNPLYTYILDI